MPDLPTTRSSVDERGISPAEENSLALADELTRMRLGSIEGRVANQHHRSAVALDATRRRTGARYSTKRGTYLGNRADETKSYTRRLKVDLKEIFQEGKEHGIQVYYVDDDLFSLKGTIQGPKCSPYAGGLFELDIQIPPDYGRNPPKIKFITEVYHPFVSKQGGIGLNILNGDDWSFAWTLHSTLIAIQALLGSIFVDDSTPVGLNQDALNQYQRDRDGFNEQARFYTQAFAHPNAVTHLCDTLAFKDRQGVQKALENSNWDEVDAVVALMSTSCEDGDSRPRKKTRVTKHEAGAESVNCGSVDSYVNVSSVTSLARRMQENTLSDDDETLSAQDSFVRVSGVVEGLELVGIQSEDDASLSTALDSFVHVARAEGAPTDDNLDSIV